MPFLKAMGRPDSDENKRHYEELNAIWWALEGRAEVLIAAAALLATGVQWAAGPAQDLTGQSVTGEVRSWLAGISAGLFFVVLVMLLTMQYIGGTKLTADKVHALRHDKYPLTHLDAHAKAVEAAAAARRPIPDLPPGPAVGAWEDDLKAEVDAYQLLTYRKYKRAWWANVAIFPAMGLLIAVAVLRFRWPAV
jgi:hypothetical protein